MPASTAMGLAVTIVSDHPHLEGIHGFQFADLDIHDPGARRYDCLGESFDDLLLPLEQLFRVPNDGNGGDTVATEFNILD